MTSKSLSVGAQPASEQSVSMTAHHHSVTLVGQPSLCRSGIDATDPLSEASFLEGMMREVQKELEQCLLRYGNLKIEIQGLGRQSFGYNKQQRSSLAIILRKRVTGTNTEGKSEEQWHLVKHALENSPDNVLKGATRTESYKSRYKRLLGTVLALCLSEAEDDSQSKLMLGVPKG